MTFRKRAFNLLWNGSCAGAHWCYCWADNGCSTEYEQYAGGGATDAFYCLKCHGNLWLPRLHFNHGRNCLTNLRASPTDWQDSQAWWAKGFIHRCKSSCQCQRFLHKCKFWDKNWQNFCIFSMEGNSRDEDVYGSNPREFTCWAVRNGSQWCSKILWLFRAQARFAVSITKLQ